MIEKHPELSRWRGFGALSSYGFPVTLSKWRPGVLSGSLKRIYEFTAAEASFFLSHSLLPIPSCTCRSL